MSSCSKLVYFYNSTHFFLDSALIFLSYVFELFVGSGVDNYPFCDIWHSMLFPEMVFLPVVMTLIPVEMTFLSAVIMFAPTEVTLFAHGGDFSAKKWFYFKHFITDDLPETATTFVQHNGHRWQCHFAYHTFILRWLVFLHISVAIFAIWFNQRQNMQKPECNESLCNLSFLSMHPKKDRLCKFKRNKIGDLIIYLTLLKGDLKVIGDCWAKLAIRSMCICIQDCIGRSPLHKL